MMREIKYKAWDGDTMWRVRSIDFDTNTVYIGLHDEFIDNITLLEYTGLKDKNGEEIYEGDIVKVPEGYSGDHFYKEEGGIVCYEAPEFWIDSKNYSDFQWNQLEVIGNIYESPAKIIKQK